MRLIFLTILMSLLLPFQALAVDSTVAEPVKQLMPKFEANFEFSYGGIHYDYSKTSLFLTKMAKGDDATIASVAGLTEIIPETKLQWKINDETGELEYFTFSLNITHNVFVALEYASMEKYCYFSAIRVHELEHVTIPLEAVMKYEPLFIEDIKNGYAKYPNNPDKQIMIIKRLLTIRYYEMFYEISADHQRHDAMDTWDKLQERCG